MKVNKTPEKLYIDVTDNPNDVWLRAFRQPFKKCGIEYIRTDAFIEKACKWLETHINDYLVKGRDIDYMFNDFRKVMEE